MLRDGMIEPLQRSFLPVIIVEETVGAAIAKYRTRATYPAIRMGNTEQFDRKMKLPQHIVRQ